MPGVLTFPLLPPTRVEQRMHLVAAAIIERSGSVLLARRSADSRLPGKWEFPGGKVEPHESPEQCLVREIAEELDITVRVTRFFTESTYRYEHGTFRVLAFRTEWLSGTLNPRIHDAVEWVRVCDLGSVNLVGADVPIAAALMARVPNDIAKQFD